MICDLLALRPISHITKKTLSDLHSTKIEQMNKTMVIFRRGAIFLCRIRCDPIPPQTSVQRFAHTRNVTTCCLRSQANAAPDWLGYSNNVDMCRSKVCFILRGHVWYVTRILIFCGYCLFWSARFSLQCKSILFNFF